MDKTDRVPYAISAKTVVIVLLITARRRVVPPNQQAIAPIALAPTQNGMVGIVCVKLVEEVSSLFRCDDMQHWAINLNRQLATVTDSVSQVQRIRRLIRFTINHLMDGLTSVELEIFMPIHSRNVSLTFYPVNLVYDSSTIVFDTPMTIESECFTAEPKQSAVPANCLTCQNYHGGVYGGNRLVCAIHPYGKEECEDWEEKEEDKSTTKYCIASEQLYTGGAVVLNSDGTVRTFTRREQQYQVRHQFNIPALTEEERQRIREAGSNRVPNTGNSIFIGRWMGNEVSVADIQRHPDDGMTDEQIRQRAAMICDASLDPQVNREALLAYQNMIQRMGARVEIAED